MAFSALAAEQHMLAQSVGCLCGIAAANGGQYVAVFLD
jgi:hypothetical protein